MRRRPRLLLGLTAALVTTALPATAEAAPPHHSGSSPSRNRVTAIAPGLAIPSLARTPRTTDDLSRLDQQLQHAGIREFGIRRRYLVRNRMLDAWNGWYGAANYRHVRYTWSGTWRIKRIWDQHGSARATAVAFCGFLSRWYPAATLCMLTVLAHYWMLEAAINRAINRKRCLITLTKRYGLLALAPGFLAGAVKCDR